MATKNTASLSLPKAKQVRGYEVKRLALGGYLSAIQLLQDLPGDLLSACFPGESLGVILERFKKVDEALLQTILGNAMLTAPKHILRVAAELTGIEEEKLLEDPEIGLDGLMEILTAWVEVNRLGDFIPAIRKLVEKVRMATGSSPLQHTGSKG